MFSPAPMPITPEAHCCRGRRADRPEFSRRRRAAVLVLLLRSQAIHRSAGTASPNGLALFRMFRAETWYRGHDVASERPGRNPHRPVDLISRRWSVEIKDLGSWNQIHLQICKTNISVGRFNLDSFRSKGNRAPVFPQDHRLDGSARREKRLASFSRMRWGKGRAMCVLINAYLREKDVK